MSDPISLSKSARESLSKGLNALQADPSVPPQLVELAAPIAQAMGALHQLERNNQVAPHADVAMNHLRGALAQLQAAPASHPAVASALDSVATALSVIHSLSRMAAGAPAAQLGPPPAAPAAPAPPAPKPITAPVAMKPQNPSFGSTVGLQQPAPAAPPRPGSQPAFPSAFAPTVAQPPQAVPLAPPPQAPPMQQPPMPPPHMSPPMQQPPMQQPPMQQPPMHAPQMQQPPMHAPQVARDPFAPQVARDPFAPPLSPDGRPATPSMPVPAPAAAGNMQLISADLGAHSPTNFYKGLSGNDIIDHGGLFISTYVPPKIGTAVRLKVSLPGGYEFEANAVVKWTREQGGDGEPGFGARFTAITPEARQLVYRYVRNREPLFYDDF